MINSFAKIEVTTEKTGNVTQEVRLSDTISFLWHWFLTSDIPFMST